VDVVTLGELQAAVCRESGRRFRLATREQVAALALDTEVDFEAWAGLLDPRAGFWSVERIGTGRLDKLRALVAAFDLQHTASLLDGRPGWSGPTFALTSDRRDRWRTPRPAPLTPEEKRLRQRARDAAKSAEKRRAAQAAAIEAGGSAVVGFSGRGSVVIEHEVPDAPESGGDAA